MNLLTWTGIFVTRSHFRSISNAVGTTMFWGRIIAGTMSRIFTSSTRNGALTPFTPISPSSVNLTYFKIFNYYYHYNARKHGNDNSFTYHVILQYFNYLGRVHYYKFECQIAIEKGSRIHPFWVGCST